MDLKNVHLIDERSRSYGHLSLLAIKMTIFDKINQKTSSCINETMQMSMIIQKNRFWPKNTHGRPLEAEAAKIENFERHWRHT